MTQWLNAINLHISLSVMQMSAICHTVITLTNIFAKNKTLMMIHFHLFSRAVGLRLVNVYDIDNKTYLFKLSK